MGRESGCKQKPLFNQERQRNPCRRRSGCWKRPPHPGEHAANAVRDPRSRRCRSQVRAAAGSPWVSVHFLLRVSLKCPPWQETRVLLGAPCRKDLVPFTGTLLSSPRTSQSPHLRTLSSVGSVIPHVNMGSTSVPTTAPLPQASGHMWSCQRLDLCPGDDSN